MYVLIGAVAGHAGKYAPWSFVLAAIVMALTVGSYAELSTRFPVSAGEAAYVKAAFQSRIMSTLTGLLTMIGWSVVVLSGSEKKLRIDRMSVTNWPVPVAARSSGPRVSLWTRTGTGVQMTYHFTKAVDMSFEDAVLSTKEALKRHNFQVLTEIDMKDNFKKGLNVDFRPYLILGACNPELSYRALQAEDKIGTMLPCNVVVQQQEDGRVEVSAIDPVASMQAVTHVVLGQIAEDIRSHLQHVIDEVGNATEAAGAS
jgi:uncharacterized protein (DUF302 family)